MRTPASIKNHPIHPMLVALPIGLWIFSLACDLIQLWKSENPLWDTVAFYSMVGGIIGALLAAVPGFVDWLSLEHGSQLKKIGAYHMALNLVAVILYAANAGWRYGQPQPGVGPVVLSTLTIILIGVSGWLGGSLVYEHQVGVKTRESALTKNGAGKERVVTTVR